MSKNTNSQSGPGRPPKGKDARSEVIRTRVSAHEYDKIVRAAERLGTNVSDYIRRKLFGKSAS